MSASRWTSVDAPARLVWDYVESLDNLALWLPHPWSAGLDQQVGAAQIGREWSGVDLQGNRLALSVVGIEPRRKLAVHSRFEITGGTHSTLTVHIQDDLDGGCRVKLAARLSRLAALKANNQRRFGRSLGRIASWMTLTIFSPLVLLILLDAFLGAWRPFRGNLAHLKMLVESRQPAKREPVLSYESQRLQESQFRDRTRDEVCERLRAVGSNAQLAHRGRREEIAGVYGAIKSLGIIDIEEGSIRWANVVRLDTDDEPNPWVRDQWLQFGIPDLRLGPRWAEASVHAVKERRFPLFGRVTGVRREGKDELSLALARRLEGDSVIEEATMSGHELTIKVNGELQCWLIEPTSEVGPSPGTWRLYQRIADHLLATPIPH